ncbi:TetR/AcrR family transcriptional regulator [Nocardioides ultimimeridianus]
MEGRDGRHARWEQHRGERRRHILDAAVAVVAEAPPGAELTLQDVAERAGLVRTVVQRHFGGRDGLLRAVQADVLETAFARILGPVDGAATLADLVSALVGETVVWVRDNPALHVLVEREVGDGGPSELSLAIAEYAEWLARLNEGIALGFGVALDDHQLARLRLLFAGVIGQVRAVVADWAQHQPQHLSDTEVREVLTDLITAQISTHAATYGVHLEGGTPLPH